MKKVFLEDSKDFIIDEREEESKIETPNVEVVSFSIESGTYIATFYKDNKEDMAYLEDYNNKKSDLQKCDIFSSVMLTIALLSFVLIFINFRWIIYILIFACLLFVLCFFIVNKKTELSKKIDSIMFDFILIDLKRNKKKITYKNKSTGTISYLKKSEKKQISVYRGYNSHTNSKYW